MSGASLAEAAPASLAHPAREASTARLAHAARVAVVGLAIFLVAAGIRLFALDQYVTIDESRWVQRAADFSVLIGQRNYEDTFIIGHPGVTTMWTALLGMGPERARHFSFLEGRDDATRRDGYFETLVAARRPFAVVAAIGVAGVALIGWRLLGPGPGLLAGALLAMEPFLVAHARVTHLDSGLTVYSSIAMLAGLVFWARGGSWPWLLLSGLATGLAFLTKAPSIYLFGFVPLMAGVSWLVSGQRSPRSLLVVAVQLIGWGLLAGIVAMLLWPALRVDPIGTLLKMAQFTERVGGGEHDNYFAGAVTDDPGPLFYPLALAIRLAPATLLGVLLLGVLWRRLHWPKRTVILWLAAYCVGFMLMMSIGPKKFDRYVLPTLPMLGLLAGLGVWTAARTLSSARRPTVAAAVVVAMLGLQGATLLSVWRYPLAYYTPLIGGGGVAERIVLVGWGEGLDQVADWLNSRPRPLGEPTIATSYHRVLQAQLQGSAVPLEHVRMADYVVPYVNTLQRNADLDVLAPFLASGSVVHTVTINGIEYAQVYRGPHYPVTSSVNADFGGRVTLVEQTSAPGSGTLRSGEEATILLRWDRAPDAELRVSVALVGADGRVLIQDERRVGEDGPDERGRPGETHRLTIPNRAPAGGYTLTVQVLEGRARTPVTAIGQAQPPLKLRELSVEATR